ncbi:hypothetical protein ACFX13_045978 [Malus domestica]
MEVDFIYEPLQQGTEDKLVFYRDPEEEKAVEAIAMGLGMRQGGASDTVHYNLADLWAWLESMISEMNLSPPNFDPLKGGAVAEVQLN